MNGFYEPNGPWAIHESCSTVMLGKMWIFGGNYLESKRQFLSVDNCQLKREGTLPFDFELGACNTVDQLNGAQLALLCFDISSRNVCHS